MDVDHYRALVRPLVEGRKVVVTGGPLAGLTDPVELVIALGAERPFVLAFGVGTGAPPGHDRADNLVLDVDAPDIVSELRARSTRHSPTCPRTRSPRSTATTPTTRPSCW